MVKDLPAMQEIWVRSLGHEDPLEKEMTTPSNILAWRIPWTEKPDGLLFMGHRESDRTDRLNTPVSLWNLDTEEAISGASVVH